MAPMAAEMVDMMIDCLHDCPDVLRSCSLVCHDWLPRSRFHLFNTIKLVCFSRNILHRCERLYAVIQQSPHIAPIICELYVWEGDRPGLNGQNWLEEPRGLILLLNSLTHLKKLYLRHIDWVKLTPELRGAFRGIFASNPITSLDINRCSFPVKSFISLFSTCPNLKSLILDSMVLWTSEFFPEKFKLVEDEEAGTLGEVPQRKCSLDDLRMIKCPPEIMSWINDTDCAFDLTHLRTLHCHVERATKTLLYKLAGSLHHLVLKCPLFRLYDTEKYEIVQGLLDRNSGLRSLHVIDISIPGHLFNYYGDPAGGVKEILLSVFGAQHLESIVMAIDVCQDLATIDWSAWASIDEIFEGIALPELVKVEFVLYPGFNGTFWSDIRDAITPLFPALAKRGILVVS